MNSDVAQIAAVLATHQPTTGMQVASESLTNRRQLKRQRSKLGVTSSWWDPARVARNIQWKEHHAQRAIDVPVPVLGGGEEEP